MSMKSPIRSILRTALAATGAVLLLSGCGRYIPAIDPEIMAHKKSLLVITSESVSDEESRQIMASVRDKAAANQIAVEFAARTPNVTSELLTSIKTKPFDGVIAVGAELFPDLLNVARGETGIRFVFLDSGLQVTPVSGDLPANVMAKRVEESRKTQIWEDWVQFQQASGFHVMWVSRTNKPVPSAWAPSEEADHVLNLDQFQDDTWFAQLSQQARAVSAQWIVTYAAVDEKTLNRIRTLRIPVLDMGTGLTARYEWNTIIPSLVSDVLSENWKSGDSFYRDNEVSVSRKE